jgi:hypothetical protein
MASIDIATRRSVDHSTGRKPDIKSEKVLDSIIFRRDCDLL